MKPNSSLRTAFLRLVLPSAFLVFAPGVGRAQLVTTATYTNNPLDSGSNNLNQKVIGIGLDGYTRFLIHGIVSGYTEGLIYVRCLDQDCDTFNTQSWVIDHLSPFAYSLAIGPDGYARIAYQIDEFLYSPDNEYHFGALGFIQCFDVDCGSSATSPFVDYAASDSIASVAVGSDGTAYVVYDNGNAEDGPQGIGLATCTGGGCGTSTLVTGISVFDQTAAAITIGSDGNPVVAYTDSQYSSDGNFTYLGSSGHYYANGTDTVVTSDASLADITIGPDGFAGMYFETNTTPDAVFVKCNDVFCSSATVNPIAIPGGSTFGSIAMAANGLPRAEIDTGSDYNSSYYVVCTAADCSAYDTSPLSDSGDSGGLVSLTTDQGGVPFMIFESRSAGTVYQAKDYTSKLSCSPSSVVRGGTVTCRVTGAPASANVLPMEVHGLEQQHGYGHWHIQLLVWTNRNQRYRQRGGYRRHRGLDNFDSQPHGEQPKLAHRPGITR